MKKATLTIGLFSLMMVLTSFKIPGIGGTAIRSYDGIGGTAIRSYDGIGGTAIRSYSDIGGTAIRTK